MVYGYARVSTKGQAKDGNSLEAQEKALIENGATKIYKEAYTGTKKDRPQFKELLDELENGDTLIVAKLDRFARSVKDGLEIVDILIEKGVTVNILNMGILDNTPTGKVTRAVFLAFAEFERDMIVERTQTGKAIARENNPNFKEGRPKKFNEEKRKHALELLMSEKKTYKEVEAITGISKRTLIRYKQEEEAKKYN